ncbi:hypothetical protein N9Y92_01325 [Chlamydiales bacterium]|nr:hypothetical protein [Chlamydiales bacterium]
MKGLTKRQAEVLAYIEHYIDEYNYSPSYREIAKHFEIKSLGAIYKLIQALTKKGVLQQNRYSARSILPNKKQTTKNEAEVELPFIGYLSAIDGIEMLSQTQIISLPKFLIQDLEKSYLLRIKGEGFQEELLSSGDLIIVEARSNAEVGETIIAEIPSHQMLIRKYFPEESHTQLYSLSLTQRPLTLLQDECIIHGIITGSLRLY